MGEGALRALKVAVVVMGVLIMGGTALLGVVITQRMSGGMHFAASSTDNGATTTNATLDESPGTHIASASLAGDRMAVALQGGGPDRVVVFDLRSGRVVAQVGLRP